MLEETKKRLCPVDGSVLSTVNVQIFGHGIELDRCLQCGGTWFDHGESEEMVNAMARFRLHEIIETFFKERV